MVAVQRQEDHGEGIQINRPSYMASTRCSCMGGHRSARSRNKHPQRSLNLLAMCVCEAVQASPEEAAGTLSSTTSGDDALKRLAPRGTIETLSSACYSDGESCL
jgi:hypothetical protein